MKSLVRASVGLLTTASLALGSVPALAADPVDFDKATYEQLLDCSSLYVLLAQATKDNAEKESFTNSAIGFFTAANYLSGIEIKELAPVLEPRQKKIMAMLDAKDPALARMMRACAAIDRVGKDAIAAGERRN